MMVLWILFVIGTFPFLCGGSFDLDQIYDSPPTSSIRPVHHFHLPQPVPRLIEEHSQDVIAARGRPATLNCRVRAIGNKTVSWLRHRDTHLLTVGRYTYTPDERFRAIHKVGSEDYMLQIIQTKLSDSGLYECQISSTPVQSHQVYLSVAEPRSFIQGGPDIFVEEAGTMNITCLVLDSPKPPEFIFWYHNDQP